MTKLTVSNILISTIMFFNICSCAFEVPEDAFEYLTPPVIIDQWQDGEYIVVRFRGYNDEYYFDGYNAYVSDVAMLRTNVRSYPAVELEDYAYTTPSFPLSPDDYDPDKIREIKLYHYYVKIEDTGENVKYPFSNGTYYIMLCAHHRYDGVYEEGVSNQVEIEFIENK